MSKYVGPEGSEAAKLVGIGDIPTKQDEREGRPFRGSPGNYLNKFFKLAGLNRGEFYLTNILKYPVKKDRIANASPKVLREGKESLIEEINSLENPKILIPFGKHALETVTDRKGITNYRGSVLLPVEEIEHDCIVIPTLHPSSLYYTNYNLWPYIVADLTKVATIRNQDFNFKSPEYNFITRPSLNKVFEILDWLVETQHEIIALDVETPHQLLSCIGLAWSRSEGICIPFYWGNGRDYWSLGQEVALWKKLAETLPKLNLAGQNIFFDWEILRNHGIYLKMPTWDSMLMHGCLYSELAHNLETIISIYTEMEFYKRDDDAETKRSAIKAGKEEDHWAYNLLDCIGTLWSIEELKKELIEENMLDVYIKLYADVLEAYFNMNMQGIPVDMSRLPVVRESIQEDISRKEKLIEKHLGFPINVKSPKQVGVALYDHLGWAPYYNKGTKSRTTGKKALEKLAYKYKTDLPLLIAETKEDYSFLSLFKEENIEDGNFRCSYSLGRTKTGRLSSRKSFSGKGRNLQNVKTGTSRTFFIPEPGHIILGGDQCWPSGTLIETIYGQIPIEKIKDDTPVFTCRKGEIKVSTVKKVFYTGVKSLVEVTVRSGHNFTTFKVTPTHNVYLSDGTKEKICNLSKGDSLMHFQRTVSDDRNILRLNQFFQKRQHRIVGEYLYGNIKGMFIHHKDGNTLNDLPDNLQVITPSEHTKIHDPFSDVDENLRLKNLRAAISLDPTWSKGIKNPRWDSSKDRVCQYCGKKYHIDRHHRSEKYCDRNCYYNDKFTLSRRIRGIIKENPSNYTFVSCKNTNEVAPVYNMEVYSDHNYILANGIVSSNCQAEARIVAYYSKDKNYIQMAESGQIHLYVGKEVYGEDFTKYDPLDPTKTNSKYRIVKSLTHGSDYRMGPYGFAHAANIPLAEAKRQYEKFHGSFPGIKDVYYVYVEEEINKNRMLYNPFGRRQVFFSHINESVYKAGCAFIPQSTSSDLTKLAIKTLSRWYRILLDLHDGLYISVPEKEWKSGVEALMEAYDIPISIWGIERKIPIDLSIGPSWGEMTELQL